MREITKKILKDIFLTSFENSAACYSSRNRAKYL